MTVFRRSPADWPASDAMHPTIIFGAFDRHNFGDLLFAHIAQSLLHGRTLHFAGLADRDMRPYGGHLVRALPALMQELNEPVNILHAGGELLTCDAWEAAVMLLDADQVQMTIAQFDTRAQERLQWAESMLGIPSLAPYTVSPAIFPNATRVIYDAVGGVDLLQREMALRQQVLANLRVADAVTIRDRQTLALLESEGVAASLLPDPAVMVKQLFGNLIQRHAQQDQVTSINTRFAQGYIAMQFSADFGDDASLDQLATQLERLAADSACGIVLFRAGAAPWHDDLKVYQRLAARIRHAQVAVFESLHIWDICALIAGSHGYCGSSLHGRIVAMAYARPRLNLVHHLFPDRASKQQAFANTWEPPALPDVATVAGLADGMTAAMKADPLQLQRTATELADRYLAGFAELCSILNGDS